MKLVGLVAVGILVVGSLSLAACSSDDADGNGDTPDAAPGTDAGGSSDGASPDGASSDGAAPDGGGTLVDAGDAGPPDHGFSKPTQIMKANTANAPLGDVDLSCLGTPSGDLPTTMNVTLSTKVVDLQSQTAVANAGVTAFANIDVASAFDTQTAAVDGTVAIHVPTGTKRMGVELTGTSSLDTIVLNLLLDPAAAAQSVPATLPILSQSAAGLFSALTGVTRTPGTGLVGGVVRDCQAHEISSFVVTVSSTQGTATPLANADAYYFNPSTNAPATHTSAESATATGSFLVLQAPVTATAYVQAWGFKNAADLTAGTLTLVAELKIPVVGDTLVSAAIAPLRTN